MLYYSEMDSPIGLLKLLADSKTLVAVDFENGKYPSQSLKQFRGKKILHDHHHCILIEAKQQLQDYFDKKRQYFELPLTTTGSEFQKKVWDSLLQISYGKTLSYKQQADILANPKAIRAVAGANSRNCIPIIIPCHRVIGNNGSLTGFAGGLAAKSFLLELEKS